MSRRMLLAACLLGAAALASADTGGPAFALEAGGSRDNLDRGYQDWTGLYLDAAWTRAPRRTVYGGLRRTARFGLHDTELMAGAYQPLGRPVTAVVEASVSPTHEVLPRWSVLGQLELALTGGFGMQIGGRHTEYREVDVNQLIAGGEYYAGRLRLAYTYYRTVLESEDPVGGHRLVLARYYGHDERSHVAAAYAAGQEIESLGSGAVQVSDVRSAVLAGRHRLAPAWAIAWEVGQHRILERYTRHAVRLGVRHEF